ncbi:pantetheine-phosphate adenylyltransferase [candidate division KSB1 bacterium]
MIKALYPGTFDPITYGHLDVFDRAMKIFDHVIIAVAHDTSKKTLFTLEERLNQIKEVINQNSRVDVEPFSGLLVEFAKNKQAHVIIRGLRAVTDFEYEMQLALMNRRLDDEIDTVFLMPNERYTYLNSSIVREVAQLGGDISNFVAPYVADQLMSKLHGGTSE